MQERFKPSVTVAAVIERDGHFLLVEEHTPEGLRLNNPAGHLEAGESLVQACARETLEETAHHFTPTALVGMYMARFQRPLDTGAQDITYLRFAFCGTLGALAPERVAGLAAEGVVRTLWMTLDDIRQSAAQHRSPLLLRCIEDYLAGQRLPLSALYTDPSIVNIDAIK